MAFQKGQSGNPGGKRAEKLFADALRLEAKRLVEGDPEGRIALQVSASKLMEAAVAGEPWAINMVADRLDGKAKQQTELTGADDGPVQIVIRVE